MPRLDPQQWTLIVVKFEMDCLAEINHFESVGISTHVKRIGNSSLTVTQTLEQGEELKAKAETVLVCFDYAAHQARPIDDIARAVLEEHLQESAPETN